MEISAWGQEQKLRGADILIIDSITHFWQELVDAYGKKKNKKRLTLKDWAEIKPEWYQYTRKYLNSRLHIFMLGRASWDFDYEEDEEGAKELTKTGTKMKVESDLGYEPSLALEMERVRKDTGKIGSAFKYRAWVIKDRFNIVNGQFKNFDPVSNRDATLGIENGVFQLILPHVQALNIGGDHVSVDPSRNSTELFDTNNSVAYKLRQRDIAIEEITNLMTLCFPGQDAASKKKKLETLQELFGTTSWTAISNVNLEKALEAKTKLEAIKEKSE